MHARQTRFHFSSRSPSARDWHWVSARTTGRGHRTPARARPSPLGVGRLTDIRFVADASRSIQFRQATIISCSPATRAGGSTGCALKSLWASETGSSFPAGRRPVEQRPSFAEEAIARPHVSSLCCQLVEALRRPGAPRPRSPAARRAPRWRVKASRLARSAPRGPASAQALPGLAAENETFRNVIRSLPGAAHGEIFNRFSLCAAARGSDPAVRAALRSCLEDFAAAGRIRPCLALLPRTELLPGAERYFDGANARPIMIADAIMMHPKPARSPHIGAGANMADGARNA